MMVIAFGEVMYYRTVIEYFFSISLPLVLLIPLPLLHFPSSLFVHCSTNRDNDLSITYNHWWFMAVRLDGAGRGASWLWPLIMCAYQKIIQISCSITFLVMRCVRHFLSFYVCVCVCVCVRARAYVHKSFQLSCSFQVSSGIPNCLPPSLSLVSLNFPLFYISICVCLSVSLFVCLYSLYLLPVCISSVRPQNATKMWNWWQVSNLGGHCNQSPGDFSNCFRLHYWHHKIQSANCPSVSSSIYMHIYLHVQISWHNCVLSHIRLSR